MTYSVRVVDVFLSIPHLVAKKVFVYIAYHDFFLLSSNNEIYLLLGDYYKMTYLEEPGPVTRWASELTMVRLGT